MRRLGLARAGRLLVLACTFGWLGACARGEGSGGTVVISAAGDADGLFPPVARQTQSRQVTDLLFEKLADIGPNLVTAGDAGWTPRLAQRWEWSADSMAVTFHLDPRARWHDGKPVRASDVRFAFSVYTDPSVGAAGGSDIAAVVESITVSDSLTCTAWFRNRSLERFFQLAYTLVPLPEHLLAGVRRDSLRTSTFASRPVGNGPFRFVKWEPRQRIEIAAVPDFYRGRPTLDRVIWTIVTEGQTAAQRVFAGEADFIETLSPPEVADAAKHANIRPIKLPASVYGFLIFNLHDGPSERPHALLADRALRRALAMSLDRPAIVRNLLDTLGLVPWGPFTRVQWPADSTLRQPPFDREAAVRTLDSLGWRAGADGIRRRGGRALAFGLLAPTSSQLRQRLAVLLQEQWRQVGVRVDVERLENTAMGQRVASRRFDAILFALQTSPSPSGLRQVWTSAAISMANGFNFGRYRNPEVDAHLDSAVVAPTATAARAHYRVAYQALLDDVPGIWLYEPVFVAAASRRLELPTFRADAWWMSIPTWRVVGGVPAPAAATEPR